MKFLSKTVLLCLLFFLLEAASTSAVKAAEEAKTTGLTRIFWQRSFSGNDPIAREIRGLRRIDVLPDGGLVGVGWWERGLYGLSRHSAIWVVRLDAKGNLLWEKTFNGYGLETGRAIAVLPGGDIVIAGEWYPKFSPTEGGRVDTLVARLDKAGEVVWKKIFIGTRYKHVEAMAVLPSGDFVVAGSRTETQGGPSHSWVLKLSNDGEVIWDRTYPTAAPNGRVMTISGSADGHILATGPAMFDDKKSGYMALVLNSQGIVLSSRVLNPDNWPSGAVVLPEGGYIVVTNEREPGSDSEPNVHFERLNKNGERVWMRSFPLRYDPRYYRKFSFSIDGSVVMPNGSIVFGWGQPLKDNKPWRQVELLKLDGEGRKIWYHRVPVLHGGDKDVGQGIWDMALFPDGRVALTGQTWYQVQEDSWQHDVWVRTIPSP